MADPKKLIRDEIKRREADRNKELMAITELRESRAKIAEQIAEHEGRIKELGREIVALAESHNVLYPKEPIEVEGLKGTASGTRGPRYNLRGEIVQALAAVSHAMTTEQVYNALVGRGYKGTRSNVATGLNSARASGAIAGGGSPGMWRGLGKPAPSPTAIAPKPSPLIDTQLLTRCVAVLKREARPMHFKELAERLNIRGGAEVNSVNLTLRAAADRAREVQAVGGERYQILTEIEAVNGHHVATIRPGHVKCQGCGETRGATTSFQGFTCEAA